MTKTDLTMHKLLGEHTYTEVFNPKVFEKEKICIVCRHKVNMKPANAKDARFLLDAFRYGMVDATTALDVMGIAKDMDLELDVVIPNDIDRELTSLSVK